PAIKSGETLFIYFEAQVIGEDEINWAYIDRAYVDGIITDEKDYKMKRDYGSGYINGDSSLSKEARHYVVRLDENISKKIGAGIGNLEVEENLANIVDEDIIIRDNEAKDNGIILTRKNGKPILYSNLRNRLKTSATFPGYITFWLNNSTKFGEENKWAPGQEDIIKANKDIEKNKYYEWNEIDGRYNLPKKTDGFVTVNNDATVPTSLFIKVTEGTGYDRIIRARYSLAQEDLEKKNEATKDGEKPEEDLASGKGIMYPKGTALTGEVEDYNVRLISGINVRLVELRDIGIDSDNYIDTNERPEQSIPSDKNDEDLRKLERVGVGDKNASLGEIVENVIEIKNMTDVEQNGFVEIDKNPIVLKINNGWLETTKDVAGKKEPYIWVKSEIRNDDDIVTKTEEFLNRVTDWRPNPDDENHLAGPKSKFHRIRVIDATETLIKRDPEKYLDDGSKYYEIIVDKILGNETLTISLRQHVTDEFTGFANGTYNIINQIIFDQNNNITGPDNPDRTSHLIPMLRDYGVTLGNEANTEDGVRHYYTADMYLGTGEINIANDSSKNYTTVTTEELPNKDKVGTGLNSGVADDGVIFEKIQPKSNDNRNLVYSESWNKVTLNLNHKGFISIWVSDDEVNWKESDKLYLAKTEDNLYPTDIITKVKELEIEPTEPKEVNEKTKATIFFELPKEKYLRGDIKRLRIRYALNKEDVESMDKPARSGEVEDYEIICIPGVEIDLLDETIDLGIANIHNDNEKIGVKDGFVAPHEDILRIIEIINKTGVEQRDVKLTYTTDIGEVDNSYYEIYSYKDGKEEFIASNTNQDTNNLRTLKISYKGEATDFKQQKSKEYTLVLGQLLKDETLRIRIKQKVLGEARKNDAPPTLLGSGVAILKAKEDWYLSDEAYYGPRAEKEEGLQAARDYKIYDDSKVLMERDYGSNILRTPNNNKDQYTEARHYIVSTNNDDRSLDPVVLVKLGENLDVENTPNNEVLEDNGLKFDEFSKEKVIYNNMINRVPVNMTTKGYLSVWLSNNPSSSTSDDYDTEYSINLIDRLLYDPNEETNIISSDMSGKLPVAIKDEDGKGLLLHIPDLEGYFEKVSNNKNDGFKYLRVRYALNPEDIITPYTPARSGEVEDYKLKVVRGFDVNFDKTHEDHKINDKYKPKDIGFYPNNWNTDNWTLKLYSSETKYKGGFNDGYIGHEEYVKHRIKITNKINYPQKNKSFIFTTSLGEIVNLDGTEISVNENAVISTDNIIKIVSSTTENLVINLEKVNKEKLPTVGANEYSNMNQYEITIEEIGKKEEIIIEFVEKIINEPTYADNIDNGNNWNQINKIFVDFENPSKEDVDRIFIQEMLRDYGSGAGVQNNKISTAQRHYLAKLDGKFIELGNQGEEWTYTIPGTDNETGRLTDKILASEDVPTPPNDIDKDEHGVALRGEKLKTLNNNYKNKIIVHPSHNGYIRIQMTTKGTRDSVSLKNATWTDAVDILTTEGATVDSSNNGISTFIEVVGGQANPIYVQTPDKPNTYQLMRVRYALDKDDLLSEDGVGRTGEIEDYVVKLAAGVEARFVDSINKNPDTTDEIYSDDTLIEKTVLHHSTVDKFIQDLGIPVDIGGVDTTAIAESGKDFGSGKRGGYHDGHLIPREEFIELIRIHNFTILDQTGDIKVIVRLKNEEFVDLKPQLFYNKNITDKASIDDVNKNVQFIMTDVQYNAYIKSIEEVEIPDNGFDRQYEIILNGLGAHKAVYLKFRARVLGEGNGEVFGDIHIEEYDDSAEDFDTVTRKLEKDYGSNHYQNETSRHYVASVIDTKAVTKDNVEVVDSTSIIKDLTQDNDKIHLIKLGTTISTESRAEDEFSVDNGLSLPEYSGIAVGGENEFKEIVTPNEIEKDKVVVLYNNFDNLIPVMPGEDGYIRFYLTPKNNTSWTTLTRGEPTLNMNPTEEDDDTLFVVNGQIDFERADEGNSLSVRIGNILGTDHSGNKNYSYSKDITHLLRARYSLLKDTKYNNAEGYNPIGEVEDYKVKVIPGFEVNFEMTEDLGVPVNEDALKNIQNYAYVNNTKNMVGTRDENIGLGEYVLQTITIINLSKLDQKNQELKLRINNGVITELVSLESITRKFDTDNNGNDGETVEKVTNVLEIGDKVEVDIGTGDITTKNTTSNSQDYTEHTLTIKNISGRETLKLTYLMKITRENPTEITDTDKAKDEKWELIQKAYDKVTNIQLAEKH
uniref:hypothetical protein n=1 Tax=Fusobacterium mortiferum TaxID=850 RepID=UPI003FF06797